MQFNCFNCNTIVEYAQNTSGTIKCPSCGREYKVYRVVAGWIILRGG